MIDMSVIGQWAGVAVLTAFLDIVWARYVLAMAARQRFPASAWAVGITVVSGMVTLLFVANAWLLLPAAVGAFLGTWFSIRKGA